MAIAKKGPKNPKSLTHSALVRLVEKWLRSRGCSVVLTEAKTMASPEEPDAIAWRSASSILVEVKVSRADFLADRKKLFRKAADMGMGVRRYFATPPGLVSPDELPPSWGLLEVTPTRVQVVRNASPQARHAANEIALLTAALVRATEGWGQGMFGEQRQTSLAHPKIEAQKASRAKREAREARTSDRPESSGPDPRKIFDQMYPKIPNRPRRAS